MELFLAFPLLLLLTLALLHFGFRMTAQQGLAAAAVEAAREAARGADFSAVVTAASRVLSIHHIELTDEGDAALNFERYGESDQVAGNDTFVFSSRPALEAGEVRVTIRLRPSADGSGPLFDFLSAFSTALEQGPVEVSSLLAVQ